MKRLLILSSIFLSVACAGRRSRPQMPPSPPPVGAVQEGLASWYGLEENGRPTASGEVMDPERFTAAHQSYPFGTVVRVDDLDSGRSVVVTINDRGPFVDGRIIDLSYASAEALGIVQKGVARVRIHVIGADNDDPTPFTWRVQVGAFSDEAHAKNLAEALRKQRYFPVLVHEQTQVGEIFFKVWVGQFSYRRDADRLAQQLRRDGHSAIVISTKSDL